MPSVVHLVAARGGGEDRAAVFERPDGIVVALADGAGGTGNGAVAAQAIVDAAEASAGDWCALLEDLDGRLDGAQATAVIATIHGRQLTGASVGDSGAWLVRDDDIVDLTEHQIRKPLVGGGCEAVAFEAALDGTLVVGSDGLFRYAKPGDIARIVRGPDLDVAARELVQLVRLPNGALQDDVSIVLLRA